ncbi:hypothetical protein N0V82_010756 [Gnomoniopsis sp. IMI 355080]|nr:hypothetical protein N0V82_010756 [Gnomoniopsis sp. IMI 355080]
MWDLVAGTEDSASMGDAFATFTWEPQPDHRGTFGIVTTCFVTLALCTWKIVHLNLPGACPDASLPWTAWWKKGTTHSLKHRLIHIFGGHQITRQIGWLLIGLFAPELIAFAAFEQYWDAKSLQTYMEEMYLQKSQNPSWWPAMFTRNRATAASDIELDEADKPIWTMTHSWYAVMGGYSYALRSNSRVHLPDDRSRENVTLTASALRFIVQHEPSIIPHLSVGAIMDKSSAGAFIKIITLFQALWFSLQCIARMGQGLSISLLELTTFAHCIVGLIIGWLWLQKPLDISMPDALDIPDDAREPHWLLAMLYTLSEFDDEEADEDRWNKMAPTAREKLEMLGVEEDTVPGQAYLEPLNDHAPLSFTEFDLGRPGTSAARSTRPQSSRPGTTGSALRPQTGPRSPPAPSSPAQSLTDLIQTAADNDRRLSIRMHLAQKGWEHYVLNPPPPPDPVSSTTIPVTPRSLKRTLRCALTDRIPNFPRHHAASHSAVHRAHMIRTHLGITLTGFLYGGLHLMAWTSSFPSAAEQTIWRIAALSLAASGLLVPVAHAEGVLKDAIRPWVDMDEEARDAEEEAHLEEKRGVLGKRAWAVYRWMFLWMIEVVRVARVVGVVVVGTVYLGLRVFIFLECLIGLGHLPASAFEVVRWSVYVPHIS